MLLEHRGRRSVVPESAYVAPSAVLCGAVVLGEGSRVLHGAVLTAENGEVRLGENSVVMENALVRGRAVATWTVSTGRLEPFASLSAAVTKALEKDYADVQRFLGHVSSRPVARSRR